MIAAVENLVLNASQRSRFAGLRDQRLCRDIPKKNPGVRIQSSLIGSTNSINLLERSDFKILPAPVS
jgi:hypothetical protein